MLFELQPKGSQHRCVENRGFASHSEAAQHRSPLRDQQVLSLTDLVLDAVMPQEASRSTIGHSPIRTAARAAPCTDPERGAGQCSSITLVKLISAQCLRFLPPQFLVVAPSNLKPFLQQKQRCSGFYFQLLAEAASTITTDTVNRYQMAITL